MKIPKTISVGDSVNWLDVPMIDSRASTWITSALWQLVYELRGPTQATATTVVQGDGWASSLTPAVTATLQAGTYLWAAYLVDAAGDRRNIGGGNLKVVANLSLVTTPIDARSVARKALEDCETALATFNKSGGKIKSYAIGGRQTEFQSLQDLMALHSFWQRRVNNEVARESIRNGRGNPRNLRVRFV